MTLSTDGPVPLYYQIKQHLRGRIERGELAPGDPVPSERELMETYAVSRPTVRQAVQELIREGLMESRRGIGTYVAQPRIRHPLSSVAGFTERMRREGRVPGTRVLEHKVMSAREAARAVDTQLEISPEAQIVRIVRLRLSDGEPILVETVHLPLERLPGIETVDLGATSLYQVLLEQYGIVINHLRETLEPTILKPHDARILGTEPGRPAMFTCITARDQSGRPIEHTLSLVRGDRCRYYVEFDAGSDSRGSRARFQQTQLEIAIEGAA